MFLGSKLKAYRLKNKLDTVQMAMLLDTTPSVIRALEDNKIATRLMEIEYSELFFPTQYQLDLVNRILCC